MTVTPRLRTLGRRKALGAGAAIAAAIALPGRSPARPKAPRSSTPWSGAITPTPR